MSYGLLILLMITLELTMILQHISRRVVGYVLINISPSNIFLIKLLPARFHQNVKLLLAAASINGKYCLLLVAGVEEISF